MEEEKKNLEIGLWLYNIDRLRDSLRKQEDNIAVACYMLGDYALASDWLDRSDKDNKLPLSAALRKRIETRL